MMQGGNPDDMERVKGVIEAERGEVEQALRALQANVDSMIPDIWNGPDADAFVAEFNDDVVTRFETVLADMETAATEMGRNADEQRATSTS
ncbi:MAG: WXG100 family type VII secretion target [Pseudoclavibacter sp.]